MTFITYDPKFLYRLLGVTNKTQIYIPTLKVYLETSVAFKVTRHLCWGTPFRVTYDFVALDSANAYSHPGNSYFCKKPKLFPNNTSLSWNNSCISCLKELHKRVIISPTSPYRPWLDLHKNFADALETFALHRIEQLVDQEPEINPLWI